jgi:transposase
VSVHVSPANVTDRTAGLVALGLADAPAPHALYADSAYAGDPLRVWLAEHQGGKLEITRLPRTEGLLEPGATAPTVTRFQVIPKRWIVERTLAWISRNRRLSKDYEECSSTSEAWIQLAMVKLMVVRLAYDAF